MICIIRQLELLAYYGEINPLGEFLMSGCGSCLIGLPLFFFSKFIMCVCFWLPRNQRKRKEKFSNLKINYF